MSMHDNPLGRGAWRGQALILGLVAAGCADAGPAGAAGSVVRDSAGVAIVESMDSVWGDDRWLLDAPSTVIGPPGTVLERVVGAERLRDGTVVVLDAGSGALRWFDPQGEVRWEGGGLGEGPDEFRTPAALVETGGDTVAVWDSGSGAVVGWVDGVRVFRRVVARTGSGSPRAPLVFGDGYLLPFREGVGTRSVEALGRHRFAAPVLAWRPGSEVADTLASIPSEEFMTMEVAGRPAIGLPPFMLRTGFAVSGGSWYVADAAPRIDAEGRSWGQIERRDASGAIERIVRLPAARGRVTDADRESYLAVVQERTGAPPEMAAALARALIFPEWHPAFGALEVDPSGHLWIHAGVVRPPLPAEGPWRVLDPEGRWLGTVAMPDGFEPLSVSDDHLTGVHRDPLGVESVWVLPIVR